MVKYFGWRAKGFESEFGPLLFLIYSNDLPGGIASKCEIFADDE